MVEVLVLFLIVSVKDECSKNLQIGVNGRYVYLYGFIHKILLVFFGAKLAQIFNRRDTCKRFFY